MQWGVIFTIFFCLQAYIEKEDSKKLKQKQRERMQPKMGKMDIDYQVLFLFSCLVYSNLVEWLGKIRIIGLQKCHLLSWWQILWLTFLVSFRFCMMHFLNIRRSQSWHHMVICIMKGKNLRYAIVFPVPPLYVYLLMLLLLLLLLLLYHGWSCLYLHAPLPLMFPE